MDEHLRDLALRRHLDERVQVPLVAVDAAIGHEAEQVERLPSVRDAVHARDQGLAREELAVANALVDAREVLIDDPAGAHVHVADFGVAHLSCRQTDGFARRDQLRVRVAAHQLVEDGLARHRDCVVRTVGANAPAVEDDEDDRS